MGNISLCQAPFIYVIYFLQMFLCGPVSADKRNAKLLRSFTEFFRWIGLCL